MYELCSEFVFILYNSNECVKYTSICCIGQPKSISYGQLKQSDFCAKYYEEKLGHNFDRLVYQIEYRVRFFTRTSHKTIKTRCRPSKRRRCIPDVVI